MIFTLSNTKQEKTSRFLGTKREHDGVWVHKVVVDTFVWALPGSSPFSKGHLGISADYCVIGKIFPGYKRLFFPVPVLQTAREEPCGPLMFV